MPDSLVDALSKAIYGDAPWSGEDDNQEDVKRLHELINRAGCKDTDEVTFIDLDDADRPERREWLQPIKDEYGYDNSKLDVSKLPDGWVLAQVADSDDPIWCLYYSKEPTAAFYASFRGCYQAGGYIHNPPTYLYASDFREPFDVWVEVSPESIDADIARDALLFNS